MEILAIGSIAYDTIQTPFVHGKHILGGSVVYFSLAASQFAYVHPVGVVGEDFAKSDMRVFQRPNINGFGVVVVPGKTFSWTGRYGHDMNDRTTVILDVSIFEKFDPKLSNIQQSLPYAFIGNIDPKVQLRILRQLVRPRLVV